MQGSFPTVVRVDDAAKRLLTSSEQVLAELKTGRLKGFCVGNEWRTTEEALLQFIEGTPRVSREGSASVRAASDAGREGDCRPGLVGIDWTSQASFSYRWPDSVEESYAEAYRAVVPVDGRDRHLLAGFTTRQSAGKVDRSRAVVFLGELPRIWPVVEFSGDNDFAQNSRMASVIKLPDGRHLRPGASIPAEYAEFPLVLYRDVVRGPYAARSIAVMAKKDDLTLMARHALIRARWKNWI
jgi:hypothetical protein